MAVSIYIEKLRLLGESSAFRFSNTAIRAWPALVEVVAAAEHIDNYGEPTQALRAALAKLAAAVRGDTGASGSGEGT